MDAGWLMPIRSFLSQVWNLLSSISLVFFIAASDATFHTLLSSFSDLTNLNFVVSKPTHSIKHHIETISAPVFSCSCCFPAEKLKAAKAKFNHMLQLEIIRHSSSPWASPLHLVLKRSWDSSQLETFDNWMPWLYPIVTQYHTFRI